MSREFYMDLADQGLAMPLAVDLLVHSLSTEEKVMEDAREMSRIMLAAAETFKTPLAVAPMDLRVEKAALGELIGIPEGERATYHLGEPLGEAKTKQLLEKLRNRPISDRMKITIDALAATNSNSVPVGMVIGPFSLLTKTIEDAITAVYLCGQDFEPDEEESVALVQELMPVLTELVRGYAEAQVKAGAKAIIMCEPAANKVYISPNLMEDGSDIFERMVLKPCREIADTITSSGADLIFHDCGELTPEMIRGIGSLQPSMLSLGSCVDLPTAAPEVPKDVVLFGNVPSKYFPLDAEMPIEKVREKCEDLRTRMGATGHPFILASECDILSVSGKEDLIRAKSDVIASYSKYRG